MKKSLMFLLAILASVSSASAANTPCSLRSFTVTGVSATYDPLENNFIPVPISIRLQTNGDCRRDAIQLALAPTNSTPQTGSQLVLTAAGDHILGTIETSGGSVLQIKNPANAFSNNPITSPLGSSGMQTSGPSLQLVLTPGQISIPGSYGALLNVLYRVVHDGAVVTSGSAPLVISVAVKPSVRLAATSNLHLDVGEIKPGKTSDTVSFDAYSNVDYELILSSDNDFTLVRNGRGSPHDGTPYEPEIGNVAITSSATVPGHGQARRIQFSAPGHSGRSHQTFSIRILPFSGVPAGNYSDLMTMEIRARI